MSRLPAVPADKPRDVFAMLHLRGLEYITTALRRGEEFDMRDLEPLVRRSRAMVEAFDWRMGQANEDTK